jgi:hypothetical protein
MSLRKCVKKGKQEKNNLFLHENGRKKWVCNNEMTWFLSGTFLLTYAASQGLALPSLFWLSQGDLGITFSTVTFAYLFHYQFGLKWLSFPLNHELITNKWFISCLLLALMYNRLDFSQEEGKEQRRQKCKRRMSFGVDTSWDTQCISLVYPVSEVL